MRRPDTAEGVLGWLNDFACRVRISGFGREGSSREESGDSAVSGIFERDRKCTRPGCPKGGNEGCSSSGVYMVKSCGGFGFYGSRRTRTLSAATVVEQR